MDEGEKLSFVQDVNNLVVNVTGYEYGIDYGVRVAKVIL